MLCTNVETPGIPAILEAVSSPSRKRPRWRALNVRGKENNKERARS